ncbi:MAG: hypothetical protein OXI01_02855 [Albidovulum sp.]|nr:hypothetical protein [Albidovulum sp.]
MPIEWEDSSMVGNYLTGLTEATGSLRAFRIAGTKLRGKWTMRVAADVGTAFTGLGVFDDAVLGAEPSVGAACPIPPRCPNAVPPAGRECRCSSPQLQHAYMPAETQVARKPLTKIGENYLAYEILNDALVA